MRRLIVILLILISLVLIGCCNKENNNGWLIGKWYIEETTEYIDFRANNSFVMNDSIYGSYLVDEYDSNKVIYSTIKNEIGIINIEIVNKNKIIAKGLPLYNDKVSLKRKLGRIDGDIYC